MIKRTIKHKTGARDYFLYTKAEADEANISYVYWPDGKALEWIISDDDMVTQCISATNYVDHNKKDKNILVKTAFGMCYYKIGRKSGKLNLEGNEVYYTLTGKRTLNGKRKEKLRMIALNYALTNDLDYSVNKVYKTYPGMKKYNWKSWTKTEGFKEMVREELTKLLAEKGFTEADTLELLEETVKLAKEKNDTKSLVTVVQLLLKMHGIDQPPKTTKIDRIEANTIDTLYDETTKKEREIEYRGSRTEELEAYNE